MTPELSAATSWPSRPDVPDAENGHGQEIDAQQDDARKNLSGRDE
jgi:hypothetical protein